MPNRHRGSSPPTNSNSHALFSFDARVQQYGLFFAGFPWQLYGCGTYRLTVSAAAAEAHFGIFLDRLSRRLGKSRVSCIAVREHRFSGCGYSPIANHWHFLLASSQHPLELLQAARAVWGERYGDHKMAAYNPAQSGAHYLAKLAGGSRFEFRLQHLDRLAYRGPSDLFAAFQTDPYVPDHVRQRTLGRTLVLRPVIRAASRL